ncbi:MAG TPA: ABC transporter permease [Puia sp.]|nr:ABC transporter permease [Puia sp.]
MFRNLIKTAWRSLLKKKGFTLINISGLALGLATFLLILFYVADELSYDRYNVSADRIYRVNTNIKYGGNTASYAIAPPPLAGVLAKNFPEVENTARMIIFPDLDIRFRKGNENVQERKVAYADGSIFAIFTLPMLHGDPHSALAAPDCIVLTERAAEKYFSRTDVVGQTLHLVSGNKDYKITGVIRNIPSQSHFNFDYFISMPSFALSKEIVWENFSFSTYVLLKPGADPKKLDAGFTALFRKSVGQENYARLEQGGSSITLNLTPLTDIHLRSNRQYELGSNNSIDHIYIFSAIALFVLLIACINFMNLSTARSAGRAREVGVRKVLGSSRRQLIGQFLSESLLIIFFATVIAALVSWALLPLFSQLAGKQLTVSAVSLIRLLPLLFGIVVVVGVIAGSYPAFFLSGFRPIHVLKGTPATGSKGGSLRNILVVFQFSISIFLIIGTLVIYNQLHYIQNRDLGFDRNRVLVVKNVNVLASARIFKQQIKQLPEVRNASLSSFLPTGDFRSPNAVFTRKQADTKSALFTEIWPVDEDYLGTMGMKLDKGRNFSSQLPTDSSTLIINQTAARMLGYSGDPLNKKLYIPGDDSTKPVKEYSVIGVLKDFNFSSLRDNITPVVMMLSESKGALSIRSDAKEMKSFLARTERVWNGLSPDQRFEYSFMDEDFNAAYLPEQRVGKLFFCFTILALFIACLGLFSMAAYAAERRNKEIGIRKVLGASVTVITVLLSRDFIKLVIVSIFIAAPLGWWAMHKWLQGFAYRQGIQWWVLVSAALGAIVIAVLTISFQSVKAALANPVESLRNE